MPQSNHSFNRHDTDGQLPTVYPNIFRVEITQYDIFID